MSEENEEVISREEVIVLFGDITERQLELMEKWFELNFNINEGCFVPDRSTGAICPMKAAQLDAYRKVWLEFRKTWNAVNKH